MENKYLEINNVTDEISGAWELPIDWDVLVAATDSWLASYVSYPVRKAIIKQLPASVTYRIWSVEIHGGELGTVEIRKLGDKRSQIGISGVPLNYGASPMNDEFLEFEQGRAIVMYFEGLKSDNIWQDVLEPDAPTKPAPQSDDAIRELARAIEKAAEVSVSNAPRPVDVVNTESESPQDNSDIQIKNKFAYLWIKRGWVRMKGYDMTRWLLENNAPAWITPKELNRHMKQMYKNKLIDKVGREYRPLKK